METFFGDPANDQAWQSAIDADPDERLRYLQSTSTALVRAIDTERRALLQPLDTLEIQATQALRTRYTELYRSGAVLEEFLRSTSELATKGEHQLSDLGIDTTSIDQWIEESDHTITELLGLSNDITWQHEHLKAFLDRLNRLTESTHIEPTGE